MVTKKQDNNENSPNASGKKVKRKSINSSSKAKSIRTSSVSKTKPTKTKPTKTKPTKTKPTKTKPTKTKPTKTKPTKTKPTKTKPTKTKPTKTKPTKTKISEDVQMSNLNYQKLIQDAKIILESNMSDGILQNELWQRLHIDDKEGSKLIVQLEKNNIATKEKIIQNGKITYKLSIKRKFINTLPIENSPCLICPVEQQCSLDGDINPKTCKLIEEWVIKDIN